MKKKSPRGIPDFSSKRGKPQQPDKSGGVKPVHEVPAPPAKIKPQATSARSGPRGG